MNVFRLTEASPAGRAFDGDAAGVSARGIGGELLVLAGHVPFVTALKAGRIRITTADGAEIYAKVSGGMLIAGKDGVRLLTDSYTAEQP